MQPSVYQHLQEKYTTDATQLSRRLGLLSVLRLLLFGGFLFLGYRATQSGNGFTVFFSAFCFIAFFILVRWYDRLQRQTRYYRALAQYNEKEFQFLQTNRSPYAAGTEYADVHHPYSCDLDLFDDGGLFAYFNRCSTRFGKDALAGLFLRPDTGSIGDRQEAVAALAPLVDFRQKLYAHGHVQEQKEKELGILKNWIKAEGSFIERPVYLLLLLFPLAMISCLLYYVFVSDTNGLLRICSVLFFLNLSIAFAFSQKITSQLSVSTSLTKVLLAYKDQLQLIEKQTFSAPLLQRYQQQLGSGAQSASALLNRLASLFEALESVINLVVSILLNGLFLFHVHVLFRLGIWKKKHAPKIMGWLEIIGEFEALGSLANFSFNNPGNCFPQQNAAPGLRATALAHPLIHPEKRVANDISFNLHPFVILTGSNMSGKSTFLRTVGINLVLARAGSAVVAREFDFYPFDVYVSMRITDSLQENESFFYAELKRLQTIIQHLQEGNTTFIILDEILRGTNSNDKRNGTIGLIRKLAGLQTYGMIATHDVVVADLIRDYPAYISNKAFESAIVDDELLFDYRLKDGVCTTLSASYLMKKLGVIDEV